jgi:hypothetical protein
VSTLGISLTLASSQASAFPTIQVIAGKDPDQRKFTVDPILLSSRSEIWAKAIGMGQTGPEGAIRRTVQVGAPDIDPDVFQYYIEAVMKDKIDETHFFTLITQDAVRRIQEVAAMAVAYRDGKTIEVLGELAVSLSILDADLAAKVVSRWKGMMDAQPQNPEVQVTESVIAVIPTNLV